MSVISHATLEGTDPQIHAYSESGLPKDADNHIKICQKKRQI